MSKHGLARSMTFPVLLLALASGCQAFHSYRPVSIEARDAETGQPIPDAHVRITYPFTDSTFAPSEAVGLTAANGIVRLKAAPTGEIGVYVTGTANGYMQEEKNLSVAEVKSISPAGLFEKVDKRPVNVVLAMYAAPSPKVELVVPPGFRGMIKAEVDVRGDAPRVPGQRLFRFEVPDSGSVHLVGPPLLGRVTPITYSAKFADDSPLSVGASKSEIGFWWLKRQGGAEVFFVGTKSEYEVENPPPPRGSQQAGGGSSGRGQGGRGRKHGGGSQSPSDSSSSG
jgi:hypothetical protein